MAKSIQRKLDRLRTHHDFTHTLIMQCEVCASARERILSALQVPTFRPLRTSSEIPGLFVSDESLRAVLRHRAFVRSEAARRAAEGERWSA